MTGRVINRPSRRFVRVSIGHAFVFTSITAANGTVDGLDTISV